MNPRLRVEVGRQANFEYEIPPAEEEEEVWLGRGAFCQIRISDPQLSRRHCQFTYKNGHLYLQDLGSRNGTRVNNQIIRERTELRDGDSVIVGSHELRVVMPDSSRAGVSDGGELVEQEDVDQRMRRMVSQEFAGFILRKVLFAGEHSFIYRARDTATGRMMALKVLKPVSVITIEDQNRFIRGARHAAHLQQPNFVRVYKGGRYRNWYYIAMEYVSGRNLQELVEMKGGPMALEPALRIARQVLEALQYAYEQQLVFRAVRPDNIIVTEQMQAKLTDYDLVKPLAGRKEAQVTRVMDGSLQVDPAFAAPELIAYPVVADQKADIFGAGAVLYFMVCGQAPFGRRLPANKPSSAFEREVHDPRDLNPKVPEAVCEVIRQAMSDYERYGTPAEMLEALETATAQT